MIYTRPLEGDHEELRETCVGPREVSNIGAPEEVIDLLARPCKKCGTDLFGEHGLREWCVQCNAQDNASRDLKAKTQREKDEELEQLVIDYWLKVNNRNRAFSTFGKHDPMDELPSVSIRRRKDRGQQFSRCLQCGVEFEHISGFAFCGETSLVNGSCKRAWVASQLELKHIEPKGNANRDVLHDLEWSGKHRMAGSSQKVKVSKQRQNTRPTVKQEDQDKVVEELSTQSERIKEKYQRLRQKVVM